MVAYKLYLTKLDKQSIAKQWYATHEYSNDVEAVKNFKKLVRFDLLKKHDSVNAVIESNGRVINEFFEERQDWRRRSMHFLHRS